ncbi:MAG: autotransporter-associated beta strand repeat-containing protein, partial [Verrucomicrobiae bacterium]|nr:autotransporter-associated beta strand repeat-containing protein [Verrucomicrobiae bacterium]
SSFNSTLGADQQGLVSPVSYAITGYDADYKIQHGNGGQMLMAAWFGGTGLDLRASLNHNFAVETNGLNLPLKVQFDLKITDSSDPSNWATVAIGSTQNAFVNDAAYKFSSLFRHSGGTQQFASGSDVSNGSTWTPAGSTIAVVLSDTAGTGSPFNGNGSLAKLYVNDTLTGTYPLSQMTASDGYVSFEAAGVFANYDNLSISVVSAPAFGVTYNGNTNTGGSTPFDPASPYAENANVTVLGNTGGLLKTGSSFSHWNTAADGSGTSYSADDNFTITAPVTLYAQWTPGPDFIWDNSAATGIWSTGDANWLGAAWVNSCSNNAMFASVGGAITLDPGITAGDVIVGNSSVNFPATSLSGGNLGASNLTVQGSGSNNGDYAPNPTLSLNSAITLSGDAAIGRANLAVTGGTLTANRIISNSASADWGMLAIQSGTVTATNGVDGSVHTAATFQLELHGGALETSLIRVANRDLNAPGPDGNNDAHLIWNGGTLKAIGADNDNFITLYGDGANETNPNQATYVQSGGAIIDTNGKNITITQPLLAPTDNGVTTISVTDGGSGYVAAPILTISGGTGSGATAIANMVDDGTGNGTFRIGSITVTSAGSYTAAPTTITQTGGGASTAASGFSFSTAANTSGGLNKNGAGTLTLTGRSTYTGAVVVNEGTLYANPGNAAINGAFSYASGIEVKSGATLRAGANGLFGWDGSEAKPITIQAGATAIADTGVDVNVGLVTLNGGTLAGSNTTTGWGSWGFGRGADKKLLVTEDSTVSATGVSLTRGTAVEVAAGKTLAFTGTIIDVNDAISGLIKTGDGTVTLSNTNTYTGVTTVSAGTLLVNGSLGDTAVTVGVDGKFGGSGTVGTGNTLHTFTVNGELSPGNSPGILTINDNLDLNGTLTMELDGTLAGSSHDQIGLNGSGDLGGDLSLVWGLVSAPAINTELLLILNDGADAFTGSFANAADQSDHQDNLGGWWRLNYAGGDGNDLSLVAIPEPGAAFIGSLGLLALLRRRRNQA